jgi:type IV pilus assembly protein PilO
MKSFTRKEWTILLLVTLCCFLALFAIHLLIYQPNVHTLKKIENELQTEQQLLAVIRKKTENVEQQTIMSSIGLQQQLPVKPLTDQLLLDIEMAEMLSGVSIEQISQMEAQEQIDPSLNMTKQGEATSSEQSIDNGFVPTGIERMSYQLRVKADDYFEMESFLSKIEELQRITEIKEFVFEGPKEVTSIMETQEDFIFEVVVTTYYYPTLTELLDEVPKLQVPASTNKQDPFPFFSDGDS